jgi:hypothetical protein
MLSFGHGAAVLFCVTETSTGTYFTSDSTLLQKRPVFFEIHDFGWIIYMFPTSGVKMESEPCCRSQKGVTDVRISGIYYHVLMAP